MNIICKAFAISGFLSVAGIASGELPGSLLKSKEEYSSPKEFKLFMDSIAATAASGYGEQAVFWSVTNLQTESQRRLLMVAVGEEVVNAFPKTFTEWIAAEPSRLEDYHIGEELIAKLCQHEPLRMIQLAKRVGAISREDSDSSQDGESAFEVSVASSAFGWFAAVDLEASIEEARYWASNEALYQEIMASVLAVWGEQDRAGAREFCYRLHPAQSRLKSILLATLLESAELRADEALDSLELNSELPDYSIALVMKHYRVNKNPKAIAEWLYTQEGSKLAILACRKLVAGWMREDLLEAVSWIHDLSPGVFKDHVIKELFIGVKPDVVGGEHCRAVLKLVAECSDFSISFLLDS